MNRLLTAICALLAGAFTATATLPADTIPYATTIEVLPTDSPETIIAKAAHVVPSPRQFDALKREFIAFVHFGPNTFSRREWGTGFEDPKDFALTSVDTDQWVKAMKDAGMKMVILTVKHHDGFVIWQSRYTDHGIMSSPYMDGKGDILRSLAESCHKYGMELGVYLSPADLYQIENPEGLYGNCSKATPRIIPRPVEGRPFADGRSFIFNVDDYNEYFLNQLFELLTEYGPISEVWFDGAHPKTKGGQKYNDAAWKKLIRTLVPDAVIFGRMDVRWGGNEAGETRPAEFNVIPYQENPDTMQVFYDMMDTDLASREKLMNARYLHYQQPEIDTSIREGWFYSDEERQRSRSADDVFDIYERSVGGNATFILNIPPNREGLFSQRDVGVLEEVGRRIRDTYTDNLLAGVSDCPAVLIDGSDTTFILLDEPLTVTFDKPLTINRLWLGEAISRRGERIEEIALDVWTDNGWSEAARATNVGYKRIMRFPTLTTSKIRLRVINSRLVPSLAHLSAHFYEAGAPELTIARDADGKVIITPRRSDFTWHASKTNSAQELAQGCEIRYTLDGSEPTAESPLFTEPFECLTAPVKATAWLNGRQGAVAFRQIPYPTAGWNVDDPEARKAIDGDVSTIYTTNPRRPLTIDLGEQLTLNGFAYQPPKNSTEGLISDGLIEVSNNGKKWKKVGRFEFGNLVNNPTLRPFHFDKPVRARYVRLTPTASTAGDPAASIATLELF